MSDLTTYEAQFELAKTLIQNAYNLGQAPWEKVAKETADALVSARIKGMLEEHDYTCAALGCNKHSCPRRKQLEEAYAKS